MNAAVEDRDDSRLFHAGLKSLGDPSATAVMKRLDMLDAARVDRARMRQHQERGRNAGWVHVALCVGYVGFPYFGLQYQSTLPLTATVEGTIARAAAIAGILAVDANGKPLKQHMFSRANRTDTGVHAVRNQVTFLVSEDCWKNCGPEGIASRLNDELRRLCPVPWWCPCDGNGTPARPTLPPPSPENAPLTVIVHRVTRVSTDYIPRSATTRRLYRYLVPLFALDRNLDSFVGTFPTDSTALPWKPSALPLKPRSMWADSDPLDYDAQSWKLLDLPEPTLTQIRGSFAALVAPLHDILHQFVGRHRFHNFTGVETPNGDKEFKIKPADDEASRVILRAAAVSFPALIPAFEETSAHGRRLWALPYVLVEIEGTGFLMHMIRKMIGTTLAIVRGASPGLIATALDPGRLVNTPMAPGNGLYLYQTHYDAYDARQSARCCYPPLAIDLAFARTEALQFEESILQPIIAFREAWLCGLLPRPDRTPHTHPEATIEEPVGGTSKSVRPPSATTLFLRMLRFHNWNTRASPFPLPSSKRKERRDAWLRRCEEERANDADTSEPSNSNRDDSNRTRRIEPIGNIIDSGWIDAVNDERCHIDLTDERPADE